MAYNERLAERIRKALVQENSIAEKTMFGGIAFLLNGNMCVGVTKDALIVRLDSEEAERALEEPSVDAFGVGGRTMKGWILVSPEGTRDDSSLNGWLEAALEFVRTLPAK